MASQDDYYRFLDVSPASHVDDIKRSYRRLAIQLHPDKNGDSPEATRAFQTLQNAYETLSDPQTRQKYDLSRPKRSDRIPNAGPTTGFRSGPAYDAEQASRKAKKYKEKLRRTQREHDRQERTHWDSAKSEQGEKARREPGVVGKKMNLESEFKEAIDRIKLIGGKFRRAQEKFEESERIRCQEARTLS